MTLHQNAANDGSFRGLHLPGFSVADLTALGNLTTMEIGDLAHVLDIDLYYYYGNDENWHEFLAEASITVTENDDYPLIAGVSLLTFPAGTITEVAPGEVEVTFPEFVLTVQEDDDYPLIANVDTITFPAGSVAIGAPGEAVVTFPQYELTVQEDDDYPLVADVALLTFPAGSVSTGAPGEAIITFPTFSLTVQEDDDYPLLANVDTITFPAGSLALGGPGEAVVTFPTEELTCHSQIVFSIEGANLATEDIEVKPLRVYVPSVGSGGTIVEILIAVNTAPVASALRFKINKNGGNILTGTTYIELGTGQYTVSRTTNFTAGISKDDYFQIELTQGDDTAADCTVHIRYDYEQA